MKSEFIINESSRRPSGKMIVKDASDYQDIANEMLDEFVSSFTEEEGLIYRLEEDEKEDFPEGVEFCYTPRGDYLISKMTERLTALGVHYFGEDEMFFIDIQSAYTIEF